MTNICFRLLICAPTNSAVDILLVKLIETGLFDNSVMKRLVAYNYYLTASYPEHIDKYFYLPELENSFNTTKDPGKFFVFSYASKIEVISS